MGENVNFAIVAKASRFIQEVDFATPHQICRAAGLTDVDGDYSLALEGLNIVYAVGLSEDASDLLCRLQEVGHKIEPASMVVYAIDGEPIPADMKLAKQPPKGGYKTPRFLPVTFRKMVEGA